ERHPDSSPEVDLRFELHEDHAGAVCVFFRLFRVLHSVGEGGGLDRLQEHDGCRIINDGGGRIPIRTSGDCAFLSLVPGSADRAGGWHYSVTGGSESLCDG